MRHLEQIVIEYISKPDTDYTLFIDGEWGCGKTYFWKNTLTPLIDKLDFSANKKWSVLYVSLNGITSSDEIISRIISERIGVQNRGKITRIALGTLGTAISVASNLFSTGDVQNTLMKNFDVNSLIDFSDKVICFDDLERISDKIDIKDLFGFINSTFVEHNSIKVILIGNSIEIIKNEDKREGLAEKDFLRIKEKLIGREVKFEVDVVEFYKNFTSEKRFSSNLSSFFKQNKNLLLFYFSEFRVKNLRTIKFFLDNLSVIIESFPTKKIPPQILNNLIYFIFIISNEFKNGIDFINIIPKKEIREMLENSLLYRLIEKNNINKNGQSIHLYLYDKYLKDRGLFYQFYESIFEYIVFGYWDSNKYRQEISNFLGSKWEGLANKLSEYSKLSDEEFSQDIGELLQGIKDGELNLYKYPSLFKFYYDLIKEKLLSIDLSELIELFQLGINKSVDKGHVSVKDDNDIMLEEGNIEEVNKIIRHVKELHNILIGETEKQNIKRILDEFDSDGDFRKLLNHYYGKQLFKYFTPSDFFNKIINSSNATISHFIFFLYSKYSYEEFKFDNDLKGLEELSSALFNYINLPENSIKKLKSHLLSGLIDQAEKIIAGIQTKGKSHLKFKDIESQ